MFKSVEKAIRKINRQVKKEVGEEHDILDFLYDAAENYEYDDDGRKATVQYIINALENEADNFLRLIKEENERSANQR